ncbi:MAG: alkaline phosphatase family protein [Polyangiaceae bacterium]
MADVAPPRDTRDLGRASRRVVALAKVFVIAMENHDASEIYGDTGDARYMHDVLMRTWAHATRFSDELPISIPSEPHYVWMEAGQSAFSDHVFTGDADPSASNSTASTLHLSTQIEASGARVTWRSYQEGLDFATGACPVTSSGFYVAKHDPFVFFQDVTGQPPSAGNARCASHHRAYSAFARDLAASDVASYTFITPNVCHDMHGGPGCANPNLVQSADEWLSAELPRIIAYARENAGVIFLTWDEGNATDKMPFFAIGPEVKRGYTGSVLYNHGSLVKSVEEILHLPVLPAVSGDNDLSDLFVGGLLAQQ